MAPPKPNAFFHHREYVLSVRRNPRTGKDDFLTIEVPLRMYLSAKFSWPTRLVLLGLFILFYFHPGCMPRPWRIDLSDPELPQDYNPDLNAMIDIPAGMLHLGCPKEWEEKRAKDPDYTPWLDRPWIAQPYRIWREWFGSPLESYVEWLCEHRSPNAVNYGLDLPVDAFQIDKYEVTAGEFSECVRAGVCKDPLDSERTQSPNCTYARPAKKFHPMNCLSASMAETYCQWKGKSLPSSEQWLRAYQGDDGRNFPWGNDFSRESQANVCGYKCARMRTMEGSSLGPERIDKFFFAGVGFVSHREDWPRTAPVGLHPSSVSPFGVHDMYGNVAEISKFDTEQYEGNALDVLGNDYKDAIEQGESVFYLINSDGWRRFHAGIWGGYRSDFESAPFLTSPDSTGFRCVRSHVRSQ